MKKSFTILEVVISITIFMILILFLYKVLDQTKYSNILISQKEKELEISNRLHDILLEDIAESKEITSDMTKDKNSLVKIETRNTYHNPYYKHVTYMIGAKFKLLRIESLEVFNAGANINMDLFFKNAYIDILADDVELFELKNSGLNYVFVIKQKDKERVFYNTYKLGDIK